jgi:hypothetical protein
VNARRGLLALGVLVVTIVAMPGIASAAWHVLGAGIGRAGADTMPVGSTPDVTVTGRNVVVTWDGKALGDGEPVAGYVLERYDGGGVPQGIDGTCGGVVTALTCTETAVPPGTWRYRVATTQGAWIGETGAPSAIASVAAPSVTWDTATTITSLPTVRSGTLASFVGGETVTFRLNDPNTGMVLIGATTPDPVPWSGDAAVSVTIPVAAGDGVHTIYAVGDEGSVATANVTVDRTAPVVTAATIRKGAGGVGGAIRQGGTYHVFAAVDDAVAPIGSVTADVSSVTTGATTVPLVAGSWTVDGVDYNYRSALRTANGTLAAVPMSFSVTATDAVGNGGTTGGFTVTVDNTAPAGADIQTANGGSTTGKAETGDTITYTFTEPMEPESFTSGWNGTATSLTVRIVDAAGSDLVEVWDAANTSQLAAFGSVRLGSPNFVSATVSFTGSTAVISGNAITLTLGTPSAAAGSHNGNVTVQWTTASSATDVAGNACTVATLSEGGGNDREF